MTPAARPPAVREHEPCSAIPLQTPGHVTWYLDGARRAVTVARLADGWAWQHYDLTGAAELAGETGFRDRAAAITAARAGMEPFGITLRPKTGERLADLTPGYFGLFVPIDVAGPPRFKGQLYL